MRNLVLVFFILLQTIEAPFALAGSENINRCAQSFALFSEDAARKLLQAKFGGEDNPSFDSIRESLGALTSYQSSVVSTSSSLGEAFKMPSQVDVALRAGARAFDLVTDNTRFDTDTVYYVGDRKKPNYALLTRPFSKSATLVKSWQVKGSQMAEFMASFVQKLEGEEAANQNEYNHHFNEWVKNFSENTRARNVRYGKGVLFWTVLWSLPTAFFLQPLYRANWVDPQGLDPWMYSLGAFTAAMTLSYLIIGARYVTNTVKFKPKYQRALYNQMVGNDTKNQRPDLVAGMTQIASQINKKIGAIGVNTYFQISMRPYHVSAYRGFVPRIDLIGYLDDQGIPVLSILEYGTR